MPRLFEWSIVEFSDVKGDLVPSRPWPGRFIVGMHFYDRHAVAVYKVTPFNLARACFDNVVAFGWWRLLRFFNGIGLMDTDHGCVMSLRHDWTWAFWRTLQRRRAGLTGTEG